MDSSGLEPLLPRKLIVEDLYLAASTRREQRRFLALRWCAEIEQRQYRYNVENCADGKKIYLLRPTYLNKGFDFTICLEGFKSTGKGPSTERPSHADITSDLTAKLMESKPMYAELVMAIDEVYQCAEPDDALGRHPAHFESGLHVGSVLKIIKWFFIEQDLTYWNYSGRRMFREAVIKVSR
jgi:hypothetical protein